MSASTYASNREMSTCDSVLDTLSPNCRTRSRSNDTVRQMNCGIQMTRRHLRPNRSNVVSWQQSLTALGARIHEPELNVNP